MSSDSDDDQFVLSSSEDETVDPIVKDAKKVASEASASEEDDKSKPAEPAKGDDDKAKKQTKPKPAEPKKSAKSKKEDPKQVAKTKSKKSETEAKEEEAKTKQATKSKDKEEPKAKEAAKKKAPTKSKPSAKKSEPAKSKAKSKKVASKEEDYDSVHTEESSSSEDESEGSIKEMINDDAEDSEEEGVSVFDEPVSLTAKSKSKPKPTPKRASPKAPSSKVLPSKKSKKTPHSDDESAIEVEVASVKRSSSVKRPREEERDGDIASVDSVAFESTFEYKPTGTMINIDDTFEEWKRSLNDIFADEDAKKTFLKSFEGVDFISNFSIRNFKDDASMDEYIERMKKQYLLRLKSNDDVAKELIRLMTARELRNVLRENGVDVKGFASENRNKASKKTPSTYAHPLPKGYRRPDDEENVKGKEAKIVYIGNPSHLPKDSGRLLPSIPIHYRDEHKCLYGPDLERLLFVSTMTKTYDSLFEKNKNIMVPLERTMNLSAFFKKQKIQ